VIAVETVTSLMLGSAREVLTPPCRLACLLAGVGAGLRWPRREGARQVVTRAGSAVLVAGLVASVILVPAFFRPIRLAAFQRVALPVCSDGRLLDEGRSLLARARNYEVAGNVTPQAIEDCYRRTIASGWKPVELESVERGVIVDESLVGRSWLDPQRGWRLTLFVSRDTIPENPPAETGLTPGQRLVNVMLEAPGYRWTPDGATAPQVLDWGPRPTR